MSNVYKRSISSNLDNPLTLPIRKIEVPIQKNEQEEKNEVNTYAMIETARKEADQIIQSAQAESEKMKEEIESQKLQWEQERKQLIEQANQQGYEEGFVAGEAAGLAQYETLIQQARDIVQVAEEDYQNKIESADEQILLIALKVAEKILNTQLTNSPDDFIPVVKNVIQEVKDYPEVTIAVHPDQYELIVFHKEEFKQLFTKPVHLYTVPDSSVTPFSVQIESPSGKIDGSIQTQIEQLQGKLLEFIREG